ncbi:hypothetical protein O6H91_05G126100 [Diphasiastrum complanatum]|uniref:Uncharacterized protein n=1 Tax=Diphasiastrum complanatum TaxID=34168 RepID=A0ACC2DT56_DIPCM|nr:hypothetical protein O6H91_05G126100 [Diphasiastrum complanatum]
MIGGLVGWLIGGISLQRFWLERWAIIFISPFWSGEKTTITYWRRQEMGRRKIEIQKIKNDNARNVTFCKRKNGLMKKAFELSVLCGVDVGLLMFAPATGKLSLYASKDRPIEELLFEVACTNEPRQSNEEYQKAIEKIKKDKNNLSQRQSKRPTRDVNILRANLKMLQIKKAYTESQIQLYQGSGIEKLNLEELQNLERELQLSLLNIRSFKEHTLKESMSRQYCATPTNMHLLYGDSSYEYSSLGLYAYHEKEQANHVTTSLQGSQVTTNKPNAYDSMVIGYQSDEEEENRYLSCRDLSFVEKEKTNKIFEDPTHGSNIFGGMMLMDEHDVTAYIEEVQENQMPFPLQDHSYVDEERSNKVFTPLQDEVSTSIDGSSYVRAEQENSTYNTLQVFEAQRCVSDVSSGTTHVDQDESMPMQYCAAPTNMPLLYGNSSYEYSSLGSYAYHEKEQTNHVTRSLQGSQVTTNKPNAYDSMVIGYQSDEEEENRYLSCRDLSFVEKEKTNKIFEDPTHGSNIFGGMMLMDEHDVTAYIKEVQENQMPFPLQDHSYVDEERSNKVSTPLQDCEVSTSIDGSSYVRAEQENSTYNTIQVFEAQRCVSDVSSGTTHVDKDDNFLHMFFQHNDYVEEGIESQRLMFMNDCEPTTSGGPMPFGIM